MIFDCTLVANLLQTCQMTVPMIAVKDDDAAQSFEIGKNTNVRQELQKILKDGGGLRLAFRLMQSPLNDHVRIMSTVEHACWDYYTHEIEHCKSPADHLKRSWELCASWAAEPHLFQTLEESLLSSTQLDFMQIPPGVSVLAERT